MRRCVWTWLGPVLTFCGSVLLFGGAMITVWRTNKSAARRELAKWRRETIVKLSSEALSAADAIERGYWGAMGQDRAQTYAQVLDAAGDETDKFYRIRDNLRIIEASGLADACDALQKVALGLRGPAKELRSAVRKFQSEAKAIPEGSPDRDKAVTDLYNIHMKEREAAWNEVAKKFVRARLTFTQSAREAINQTG